MDFEPLISMTLLQAQPSYQPGDTLKWEFQLDAVPKEDVKSVETSVLWQTEGKGDEDIGVHYFKRAIKSEFEEGDLRVLQKFETVLPNSPLSYDGSIVKIKWLVRVRAFLAKRKSIEFDIPVRLIGFCDANSESTADRSLQTA